MASPLKRKADKPAVSSTAKKQKFIIPEYHKTPQRRDGTGEIVWPARKAQLERAREIIKEWYVHLAKQKFELIKILQCQGTTACSHST